MCEINSQTCKASEMSPILCYFSVLESVKTYAMEVLMLHNFQEHCLSYHPICPLRKLIINKIV